MPAKKPPPSDSQAFGELDAWERIDAMPDHRPLKTSEAAIFMTFGLSTVERMRVDGTGPDYFQAGMRVDGGKAKAASGSNQAIRYFKPDIAAWFQKNKVSSSIQAASRKGQTFASLADMVAEAAFFVDKDEAVLGPVDAMPLHVVLERLEVCDIVWMPAFEAAARRWAGLAEHKAFAEGIKRVLSRAGMAIDAGIEATDLAAHIPEPESAKRGAPRD